MDAPHTNQMPATSGKKTPLGVAIALTVLITLIITVIGTLFAVQKFVLDREDEQPMTGLAILTYEDEVKRLMEEKRELQNQLAQLQQQTNNGGLLKNFTSSMVNLSFNYSGDSEYQEIDGFAGRQEEHVGKHIRFIDDNKFSPTFETVTNDFFGETFIPHDLIEGDLSSKDSFKVIYFDDKYSTTAEKGRGIYQITGYGNIECSPFISSFLLATPPADSDLKYIMFNLGSASLPEEAFNDSIDPCAPDEAAIISTINSIVNGEKADINKNFDSAMKIAATFK